MLLDYFGFSAPIVAICIMALSYIVIFSETVNRAVVALLGGAAMIVFGILSQEQAIAGIDFNTLNLLIGMMIIMAITEKTGFFQFIAIWVAKAVRANPRALLVIMTIITTLLSGYIDNVTTVLLMTPILIKIVDILKVRAFPYLMMTIFSCNIGGAATLIGDPPNILIGSKLGLSFVEFLKNMTPISYFLVFLLIVVFDFIWGRKLQAESVNRVKVMNMHAHAHLNDKSLLIKSLSVLTMVLFAFVFAHRIGFEVGTISIIGSAVLMFLYTLGNHSESAEDKVRKIFAHIDWITIFFFAGLFVIVAGLESTGILEAAGHKFVEWTHGDFNKTLHIFLWSAAGMSSIMDNIPFVATIAPIVETIEYDIGGRDVAMPLWWALLMGACYGGNGTIIASSANLVVAGIAAKSEHKIGFIRFMLWGIPVVIASTAIASLYLYIFFHI